MLIPGNESRSAGNFVGVIAVTLKKSLSFQNVEDIVAIVRLDLAEVKFILRRRSAAAALDHISC